MTSLDTLTGIPRILVTLYKSHLEVAICRRGQTGVHLIGECQRADRKGDHTTQCVNTLAAIETRKTTWHSTPCTWRTYAHKGVYMSQTGGKGGEALTYIVLAGRCGGRSKRTPRELPGICSKDPRLYYTQTEFTRLASAAPHCIPPLPSKP